MSSAFSSNRYRAISCPHVKDFAFQQGFRKTSDCVCQSSGNLEFATLPWHLLNLRHIFRPVSKYIFLYTSTFRGPVLFFPACRVPRYVHILVIVLKKGQKSDWFLANLLWLYRLLTASFVFQIFPIAIWSQTFLIQGPTEIPDDFATQLWVEPLAWEIYLLALF